MVCAPFIGAVRWAFSVRGDPVIILTLALDAAYTHQGNLQTMKQRSASVIAMLAAVVGGCGSQSNATQKRNDRRASLGQTSTVAVARRMSSTPVLTRPGTPGPMWKPVASIGGQHA